MTCSVIMTCYNEGPYIEAAVRSVLDQTRADVIDRIVIADDGSAPDTIAVLHAIEALDPRIEVIYGEGGLGLPGNRNLAATRCTSPYLAILDGDDLWTPDKLEKQLPLLDRDAGVGLVYADYYTFPNQDLSAARAAGVLDITRNTDLTLTYFLNDPPIIPSTILLRRDAFEAAGRFDAAVRVFEDTDFYLRLSRVCRFALVDAPLLYKRNRTTSITGGRKDLMAHHAYVAFKFAAEETRLLPIVPRRLAERARKLGNYKFLAGDREGAVAHLRLATKLDAWNIRAWTSWVVASFLAGPANLLLKPLLSARRAAIGSGNA
ncbi:glycosyltransferase family 2 protein [Sphingomonas oleivorans]|nr:glycosyltransferase family 2 protein [Sphingomonas oleivorans]